MIPCTSAKTNVASEGDAEAAPAKRLRSASELYPSEVWEVSPKAGNPLKARQEAVWEVPPKVDPDHEPRADFAVAKHANITPLDAALLDSYIEGYQRTTTLFFGRIVSNPDDLPAFAEPLGYNMTYNGMATGNGNALHRHNSVEIFVALDAPFEIAYGSNGEFKAQLQPWDVVACPAEAIHSYKNMGADGGQILTYLCGKPAIQWAPGVVDEARKRGAECDDTGILLKKGSSAKLEALQGVEADELILQDGALDKFVYRYEDRDTRSLKVSSSAGAMRVLWKDLTADEVFVPDGSDDTLVVVLKGSLKCQGWTYTHLDVLKQPNYMVAGTDGATLLVTRSNLPHNLRFFFDADITA